MREQKTKNDSVFEGVHNSQFCNNIIEEWIKKAKIDKHITFHCFRHTFATLQLTQGTDIYTQSARSFLQNPLITIATFKK
ncbi:MAG: tyrosine-type recombinase/integrase [Cytophagaceae bacterium]|nr:tyrosine-type recombinase/integrase [Cytophagaceae bacterium]